MRASQPVRASAETYQQIDPTGGDIVKTFAALYVGVTGNIKVDSPNGDVGILFTNVPVGMFPVAVAKVYQTGTTATGLVGINW